MSGSPSTAGVSTALLTDRYELTMVAAALADGTASRQCVFELFARRLPDGRRYGVVAGTGRLLESINRFRFGDQELAVLDGVVDRGTLDWLADYRFTGDVDGYPEGELYFPGSPILTVIGTFADAVVLETLALSILNHDSAVASAAARMVSAAAVPAVGMPWRRSDSRFDVAEKPARYAARAAATAAASCVRRDPISMIGRPAAAETMRAAAEATALSWLRIDRARVSSTTASANVPRTVRIGEPGKYSSPSG